MEKCVLHWIKMTILKVTELYRFLLQLQFEVLFFFFKKILYNFAIQKRKGT